MAWSQCKNQNEKGKERRMRGLAVKQRRVLPGELEQLVEFYDDLETPTEPWPGHVIVRVLTAAISLDEIRAVEGTFAGYLSSQPNRVDAKHPLIPGMEACGVIVKVGKGKCDYKVGDVVLGFPAAPNSKKPGVWCEYTQFPMYRLKKKPDHLTPEEAVATHLSALVAVAALDKAKSRFNANPKAKVLLVGATGNIGVFCLQMLRFEWPELDVFAVCSSRSSTIAKENGASTILEYDQNPNWNRSLQQDIDVVIDLVGGVDVERMSGPCIKNGGLFVTMVGPEDCPIDKRKSLCGFLSLIGRVGWHMMYASLFKQYSYTMNDLSQADESFWSKMQENYAITASIERVVPFEDLNQVREAIQKQRTRKTKGKVILKIANL